MFAGVLPENAPHVGERFSLSPASCAHVCLSREAFSTELVYLVTELAWSPRSLEASPEGVFPVGGPPGGWVLPMPTCWKDPRWPDRPLVRSYERHPRRELKSIPSSQGESVYVHRGKPFGGGGKALQPPPPWER